MILFIVGFATGIVIYKLFKTVRETWQTEMGLRNRASSWPRAKH